MDVNKEAQVETEKRNAWVLTYGRLVSNQEYEYIIKVYTEKPTIIDLAHHFVGHGDKIRNGCAMSALVFLDDLVNGRERYDHRGGWYTLKEVTES